MSFIIYKPLSSIPHDVNDYIDYKIYYFDKKNNEYRLVKKKGQGLSLLFGKEEHKYLYVSLNDKLRDIEKKKKIYGNQLLKDIKTNKIEDIKKTIVNVVENTFAEPRSGTLKDADQMVNLLIDEYAKKPQILITLARISDKDYTTIIHSINVMAFVIGYCTFNKFPLRKTKLYGLSALLHDIGKTEINDTILKSNRKLSDEEIKLIHLHPIMGSEILNDYKFPGEILEGCLQHHERLDGSGYPYGLVENQISEIGKLLSIIDPYEALTALNRPYKKTLNYQEALEVIYTENKKIDKTIFANFVKQTGIIVRN